MKVRSVKGVNRRGRNEDRKGSWGVRELKEVKEFEAGRNNWFKAMIERQLHE